MVDIELIEGERYSFLKEILLEAIEQISWRNRIKEKLSVIFVVISYSFMTSS